MLCRLLARCLLTAVLLAGAGFAPRAHAGIPVIDAAAVANLIEQVVAWGQQYYQMYQQIQQLQRTYASITGGRGLGRLLYDPALRELVPAEAIQTYQAIRTGGMAGLTSAARNLRQLAMLYNCEDRRGTERQLCERRLNMPSQTLANAREAYTLLIRRMENVERFMDQIDATDDLKAIADLQARIQVEISQITNDANRMAALRDMDRSENAATLQAAEERVLQNMTLPDDGSDAMRHWMPGRR